MPNITGKSSTASMNSLHLDTQFLLGIHESDFLGGDTPDDREEATVQVTQSLVGKGIWAVRVHGVKANKEAITS